VIETIRYGFGRSSLGDFVLAVSDCGMVAFEFTNHGAATLDALGQRLSGADLRQDDLGLAETAAQLSRLVDHPRDDPGIPLDPRGSDYQKQVWSMLREIPIGRTTSYGALAGRIGTKDARPVTEAIASNTIAILIPCHRVVKKDGSLSGYRWGVGRKRALLDRERQAAPFTLGQEPAPA
jgi:AraC family transcriptional regulator of adaptative response/methylated-DNA-[protein]-cysteine methyltransferase